MKNKSKRNNRKRIKSLQYEDNIAFKGPGQPSKDEGSVNMALNIKALRKLPKSTYSFMADPYTPSDPTAEPYAVVTGFNKTVSADYLGLRNLDGGNVQQYANSNASKMLSSFDFARMRCKLNYRYQPSIVPTGYSLTGNYPGKALIDESIRSTNEALSILKSTTYTQMAINDYYIETDMPMGSSINRAHKIGSTSVYRYEDQSDVLFAALKYYQLFWQQVLQIFNWHNSFRLKMGNMIRSSFNRETPQLNALFGQFKKKSFLSLMDSIAMSIPGEYIDKQFMEQINLATLMPSRRSDSLLDPTLEVQADFQFPTTFRLCVKTSSYDFESDDATSGNPLVFDQATSLTKEVSGLDRPYTFLEVCSSFMEIFSAERTMAWARNTQSSSGNATEIFNSQKYKLDVIQLCITTFKLAFTDVRQALDTLVRTGLVTWYKGFYPTIVKDTDSVNVRNMIVDDIFRVAGGGAQVIKLDPDTKRWRTFALWNLYDGIPSYDMTSGGSFLTFSLKDVDISSDQDGLINYMPIALIPEEGSVSKSVAFHFTARDGISVVFNSVTRVMNDVTVLKRLVPLSSQDDLQLRVVLCQVNSDQYSTHLSFLYKVLTQVFGVACISLDGSTDYSLDPDVIAVYQVEIEDITNEMLAYARSTAPLRGSTGFNNTIGFLGSVK